MSLPAKKMNCPSFLFTPSQVAAEENWNVLKKHNLDLKKALDAEKDTQLGFGSEFKDASILHLIFKNHPLWSKMSSHISNGCSYPLEHLEKEKERQDVIEAFEFGNHKGIQINKDLFTEMMNEEIRRGWVIIVPRAKILELENTIISPMNIATQMGINESGNLIEKKRLTHNQSMIYGSNTSVNSRTIEDELQDVMYGKCILRVIHDIVARRSQHPLNRIFLQKVDYKSAYRRSHLSATAALQTITQDVDRAWAFIYLRLTFGGTTNPSFWGDIAEPITDLANAILECPDWDPLSLHASIQDKVPATEVFDPETPFEQALPLAVNINPSQNPKADIYIDDTTTVTVDINDNCTRAERAVLLAIEIAARKLSDDDPIPQNHIVSMSKLKAEAALEETKILLGWALDTRRLLVSLPDEKFKVWSLIIKRIIDKGTSNHDELDSTIGRLTHVSVIIPHMKHFMSRLRQEKSRAQNRRSIKLKEEAVKDLKLHLNFLIKARDGINMNLLTYRKPTHVYRGDACPFGLGGYSAAGRAWRWYIPKHLQFRATINMLEHLAAVISPWIDILEERMPPLSCILSMTDSTSTAGWLRKSNFQESNIESKSMTTAKLKISRGHATRLLDCQCCDYSQWFPGDDNDVADALSRDNHISDDTLTSLLFSSVPEQVPPGFKILPIPPEIESFISSLLASLPEATQIPEKHKHSRISLGLAGLCSSDPLIWNMTSSSATLPTEKEPLLHQFLQTQSDTESFLDKLATPWCLRQSAPPWTTYLRPSETLTLVTPGLMNQERLHDFYCNSLKATKKKIQMNAKKRQFHSVSSANSTSQQCQN